MAQVLFALPHVAQGPGRSHQVHVPGKRCRFAPAEIGQGAGRGRNVERQDLRLCQFEKDRLGRVRLVGEIYLALRLSQGLHRCRHVPLCLPQVRLGHQAIGRDFDLERGTDGRGRIGKAPQAHEYLGQVGLQLRRFAVKDQGPLQLRRRLLPALLLFIDERAAGVLVGAGIHRTRDDPPIVDQLGDRRRLARASPQAHGGQGEKKLPSGSRNHPFRLAQGRAGQGRCVGHPTGEVYGHRKC